MHINSMNFWRNSCVLISIALLVVACSSPQGGSNQPHKRSTVAATIGSNQLLVPTTKQPRSSTAAPTQTTLTLTGNHLQQPTTVVITDAHDDNNSLKISTNKCTLDAEHAQCAVTVSAVVHDHGSDRLQLSASDATGVVSVMPAVETITFETSPPTPPTGVEYTLDATNVSGHSDHPVAYIQGINKVSYPTQYFYINTQGYLCVKNPPPPGIYQINVKAQIPVAGAAAEVAYSTFYLHVSADGSLQRWQTGSMPTTNRVSLNANPLTMIYSYTHSNVMNDKEGYLNEYKKYAQEVASINTQYLANKAPINALAVEFDGPQYPVPEGGQKARTYWQVDATQSDIKQQITAKDAIANGYKNRYDWLPELSSTIKQAPGLSLAPDITFGQNVRAAYNTYNAEQLSILANTVMKFTTQNDQLIDNISGVSFDLEKGTDASDAAAFKVFADHLAYRGLFFGYYEFADKSFQPGIVAAMGPLGVAFISSYDVGSMRASKDVYNAADASGNDFGNDLYDNIFRHNVSCTIHTGNVQDPIPNPVGRYSWCNLSANDSYAANIKAWSQVANRYNITTQDTMQLFNGHYSITLPIGESSTDFSALELINPDFAKLDQTGAGLVMSSNDNCSQLTQNNKSAFTKDNLDKCLFAGTKIDNVSFGSYQHCDQNQNIPYSKCILILSNLDVDKKGPYHPTQSDYIAHNIAAYNQASSDSHMIGYSLFALQDAASAPNDGAFLTSTTTNQSIQEPWNVGGADINSKEKSIECPYPAVPGQPACDPFYDTDLSKHVITGAWSEFGNVQLDKKSSD